MVGTKLKNADGVSHGLDFGTYLESLDGYFNGFNEDKFEDLLIVDSLGYNVGKVLGSYVYIKPGYTDDEAIGTKR